VIRFSPFLFIAEELSNDSSTIEKSFDFGVGTALAALLFVLALRSSGETRAPRLGFAVCALVFTLAAFVSVVAYGVTQSLQSPVVILASDVAFCATASWPVPILALWAQGPYSSEWRRRLGQLLIALAGAAAIAWSFAHIAGLLNPQLYDPVVDGPMHWLIPTAYNGFVFLWVGTIVLLAGRLKDRLSWLSVAGMLAGITCPTLRGLEQFLGSYPAWLHVVITFLKPLSLPFMVAGGLFGFSRFRFTDIFAQRGLRILLGAFLALACSLLAREIFGAAFEHLHSTGLAVLAVAAMLWITIVCYAKIAAVSDWLVDRRIFRQAGYHRALKSFRETIATESDLVAILDTGKNLAKETLRIADAAIQPMDDASEPDDPFTYERAHQYTFRILKGDNRPAFGLVISPGVGRLTLFNAEIDFLREICLAIGRRLEAIDREKQNIESARREEHLLKQLVEAELRALRAQINPHFLFNSLNSIAALITTEPQAAEEMIIRLAKIFRHVLTYHDRPFSSVNEEISFLQTYLEIEKVRFGDRLQVTFDIEESVAHLSIPTLILQPLVENSIKHGLGPKVGENQLTIRARQQTNYLELTVEDNGIGAIVTKKLPDRASKGLGLRNVEERLQTVYRGDARFCFESVPRLGSRAQILIPIVRKNQTRGEAADITRVSAQ
jgi:two-component system LytT family sensor kinase